MKMGRDFALVVLFLLDFIKKQVEKKIGVDLNGDGVVGSGTHSLPKVETSS